MNHYIKFVCLKTVHTPVIKASIWATWICLPHEPVNESLFCLFAALCVNNARQNVPKSKKNCERLTLFDLQVWPFDLGDTVFIKCCVINPLHQIGETMTICTQVLMAWNSITLVTCTTSWLVTKTSETTTCLESTTLFINHYIQV